MFQISNFKFQITTHSEAETRQLGRRIGEKMPSGMVIALIGDLGSGKTVLVQGLGKGLNVPNDCYIVSPTYMLINEYSGRLPLYHVDLYRIGNLEEMEETGFEDILNSKGVVAVEWADRLGESLPAEHLAIRFESIDADSRRIMFSAYGQLEVNLLKKIETD